MTTIKVQYVTETAHRLMYHEGKCSNIHGHRYEWIIYVSGYPDRTSGMILDFSDLKQIVKDVLEPYDHALILNQNDPLIPTFRGAYRLIVYPGEPTAESMAAIVFNRIAESFNGDVTLVGVECFETATNSAYYGGV